MLFASSPIAIYRALISLQDKEVYIIILQSGQVMIRHPRGENSIFWLFYFPLIIARLPVNLAKKKCGRESGADLGRVDRFVPWVPDSPKECCNRERESCPTFKNYPRTFLATKMLID